jgi:hypothetical protein
VGAFFTCPIPSDSVEKKSSNTKKIYEASFFAKWVALSTISCFEDDVEVLIKVDDTNWVNWVGKNKKLVNKLKKSYLSCSPEWFDQQGDDIQNIVVTNFEIGKLVFEENGIPSISSVAFDFSFSLGGKTKVSNPDIFDALRF